MQNMVEIVNERFGGVTGTHIVGEPYFTLFFNSKAKMKQFIKETSFLFEKYSTKTNYVLAWADESEEDVVETSEIENYSITGELKMQ